MALSYKARKRWSLVILLVGLPLYIVAAISLVNLFARPSFLLELAIYVALGALWALPFRFVFVGVGQPDPDAPRDDVAISAAPKSETPEELKTPAESETPAESKTPEKR